MPTPRGQHADLDREHLHRVTAGLAVDADGIEAAANGEEHGVAGPLREMARFGSATARTGERAVRAGPEERDLLADHVAAALRVLLHRAFLGEDAEDAVCGGAVEPRFLDDVGEPYPALLPDREDAQDLHRAPDALRAGDLLPAAPLRAFTSSSRS